MSYNVSGILSACRMTFGYVKWKLCDVMCVLHGWRNRGGGRDRGDLPLRAPLISFPGWDPGGPIYNKNEPFLLLLDCFSAVAIVVWMVLGPLRHLRTLFLGAPKAKSSPTSGIISPALVLFVLVCSNHSRLFDMFQCDAVGAFARRPLRLDRRGIGKFGDLYISYAAVHVLKSFRMRDVCTSINL